MNTKSGLNKHLNTEENLVGIHLCYLQRLANGWPFWFQFWKI